MQRIAFTVEEARDLADAIEADHADLAEDLRGDADDLVRGTSGDTEGFYVYRDSAGPLADLSYETGIEGRWV